MDLSSSSSEDGNKAKDFLNELSTLQTNNLSQTFDLIADMKEEMGDIKEKLAKTENKLAETEEKLAEMSEKTEQQESQIESLSFQIDSLGARGHWCGNKDSWYKDGSTITYDSIFYSDSNMNITDTPLNINTGVNSHNCYYNLDINICHIAGIFTVPVSGAWRLTLSLMSWVDLGEYNFCYLYINGDRLDILWMHYTASSYGLVQSTGGRMLTVEASTGDKLEIRIDRIDGRYYNIQYCAEFIPKL